MTRPVRIREVWAANLEDELRNISYLLDHYNYVAMDTEFPGVVARPVGAASSDVRYQTLRCNVDLLNVIQLGLSLSNADGEAPPDCATWQFNFAFDLAHDLYAQDSIDLLTTSGLDFAEHQHRGIDVLLFGELLTSSGLVLNDAVTWISFHGSYDFAYLVKILTAVPLPSSERDFFELLHIFFPHLYDLKYLMLSSDHLHGGLNKLADTLGCQRVGTMHQAGSDSLLTLHAFFRMRHDTFKGQIDPAKNGILYGLSLAAGKSPAYSPDNAKSRPTERVAGNGSAGESFALNPLSAS